MLPYSLHFLRFALVATAFAGACGGSFAIDIARTPLEKWRIDGLRAAWTDRDQEVKDAAFRRIVHWQLLSEIPVEPATVEAYLKSKDSDLRTAAIYALGQLRMVSYHEGLRALALHKDPAIGSGGIRCASVQALLALGKSEDIDFIAGNSTTPSAGFSPIGYCLNTVPANLLQPLNKKEFLTNVKAIALAGSLDALELLKTLNAEAYPFTVMELVRKKQRLGIEYWRLGEHIGSIRDERWLPEILELLMAPEEHFRYGALMALENIGIPAHYPLAKKLFISSDGFVAIQACNTMTRLNPSAALKDIRAANPGREICSDQLALLGDKAAEAKIIERSQSSAFLLQQKLPLLKKIRNENALGAIIDAVAIEPNPGEWVPTIDVIWIRPLHANEILRLLRHIYDSPKRSQELRLNAYLNGGGEAANNDLIVWLGNSKGRPLDNINRLEALRVLSSFEIAWLDAAHYPKLLNDLEAQAAQIIKKIGTNWRPEDIPRLEKILARMEESGNLTRADTVTNAINQTKARKLPLQLAAVFVIHALFWTGFLLLYPRFAAVRAIFFWNPWVRKIGGLGYIGLLLTWVPFLRRRLFAPFRAILIEDVAIGTPSDSSIVGNYFDGSEVEINGKIHPINEKIVSIRGRMVLEGESGLGKTMLLRHLIRRSERNPLVYLAAAKCAGGVIEAIAEKLEGHAADKHFLRTLIYSGALDVVIDGLNEVGPDTIANIRKFLSSNASGNIIVATQPFNWAMPTGVTHAVIQPLSRPKMREFLYSRESSLTEEDSVRGGRFLERCDEFISSIFSPDKPASEINAAHRLLANPMDLTVVANLLAMGEEPKIHRLQQHQFDLMAADYKRCNADRDFPLSAFSLSVFNLRVSDTPELPSADLASELAALADHKMIFKRVFGSSGSGVEKWYFRHDKIGDFFVFNEFLADTKKQELYIDDARFRGVYFLLAAHLSAADAALLLDLLLKNSADKKDHTVSDGFIKVVRDRSDFHGLSISARANESRQVA